MKLLEGKVAVAAGATRGAERGIGRVKKEQGQLDILVNDVWGGDELTEWSKPFWKQDQKKDWLMLARAVHAHILTSRWGVSTDDRTQSRLDRRNH